MASASRHTTVVIGALAACLLAISATLAFKCSLLNQKYKGWISHHPCETRVDLSRPGASHAGFEQTCAVAHGEYLSVTVRPAGEPGKEEALPSLFAGLEGQVVIRDRVGREVERQTLDGETVTPGYFEGEAILCHLSSFEAGDYTIAIEVERGAQELAGREQTVFASYLLCGSEFLPGVLAGLGSIGAGLAALVLGLVFLFRIYRAKSRGELVVNPAG